MSESNQDKPGFSHPIRGTAEWAVALDCSLGCSHDCRYCYGRYEMVTRQKRLKAEDWIRIQPLTQSKLGPVHLYPGQVMFPSNHDIVPENIEDCIRLLTDLLDAGNTVLIVSKPHLDCIGKLCTELASFRQQILFRFTITARDDQILSFWEPGAPLYTERRQSLMYAWKHGFTTSVSVEPMLDVGDVEAMVQELAPYVRHSIWLGLMRRIEQRVDMHIAGMEKAVEKIRGGQQPEAIRLLYQRLKDNPLIRWKESAKEIIGLALADKPGLDI